MQNVIAVVLLVLMFVVCWKLIEVCGPFLGIVICGMLAAGLGWFLGWLDSRRWK